jgi:uncharacterized protein (DUF1778 family)
MAITIRLTDEHEQLLEKTMILTGQSTKSKVFLYLLENAIDLIKHDSAFRQIKALEEEIAIKHKMIAKLKAGK